MQTSATKETYILQRDKKYYIAPEFQHQIGVETWEWEKDMFEIALAPLLLTPVFL